MTKKIQFYLPGRIKKIDKLCALFCSKFGG